MSELDTDNLHARLVIAPSGMAIIGAMRFAVPGVFATALFVVAAAGIWYAVLRPLAPYEDDDEDGELESHRSEQSPMVAGPCGEPGPLRASLSPSSRCSRRPQQQQPLPPASPAGRAWATWWPNTGRATSRSMPPGWRRPTRAPRPATS